VATRPVDNDATDDTALWARYRLGADDEVRDVLVNRYERLVRIMAAKAYSNRISSELEFGDYYQYGMVGLLQAFERFDPALGARFETFASRRVAGAILDGVETLSEKQHQVATRQRAIKERAASMAEGATVKVDPFQKLVDVALGLALGFLLEDTGMYVNEHANYADNCYSNVELKQLKKRVHAALRDLPDQERKVITLHYLQHQPFDAIAVDFELTKGRISQIHHSALKRLRVKLNPDAVPKQVAP
jgi:RNA polymerase sigma factor FliA